MTQTGPRIALLRPVPPATLEALEAIGPVAGAGLAAPATPAEQPALLAGAEVAFITAFDEMRRAQLDLAPRLQRVVSIGSGLDRIDLEACRARGIAVRNASGGVADGTADMAFALMLAAARNIAAGDRFVRDGRWAAGERTAMGADVFGATLGIVGFGRIGRAIARRGAGFGMRMLYTARTPKADTHGAERAPLAQVLHEADFVIVQAPLTEETRGMIDAAALALMKPTAVLVNTGRGPVVDAQALAGALHAGRIAGAALDVFDAEPDVPACLLDAPNLTLSPHVGGATPGTHRRLFAEGVEILREMLAVAGPD